MSLMSPAVPSHASSARKAEVAVVAVLTLTVAAAVAGLAGHGPVAAPQPDCARMSEPQAMATGGLLAEVRAARAARDKAMLGGSLYAAAKLGLPPGSPELKAAEAAQARLDRAEAALRRACGPEA